MWAAIPAKFDQDSGDVAVVRVRSVLARDMKTKPLFTFFPTAARPQSAAIVPTEGQA
jgi:hypothetical protein